MLLYGKKSKTMDFSETIVFHDIKVGIFSQLNEYMNLYEYQRSRSFIDLRPNHSDSVFLNFFSSVTSDFNISSALRWAIQDQWPLVYLSYLFGILIFMPLSSKKLRGHAPKFEEVEGPYWFGHVRPWNPHFISCGGCIKSVYFFFLCIYNVVSKAEVCNKPPSDDTIFIVIQCLAHGSL